MSRPTPEELAAYEIRLKEWEDYMEKVKPQEPDPCSGEFLWLGAVKFNEAMAKYWKDLAAWKMERSCGAPNRPGYERANND